MKTFGAFVLVGAVAAFYLGYSPSDLMALWPSGGGSNPPPKVRHAAAPAEPGQNAAPVPQRGGPSVVAGSSNDGSLEQRWGPTKP